MGSEGQQWSPDTPVLSNSRHEVEEALVFFLEERRRHGYNVGNTLHRDVFLYVSCLEATFLTSPLADVSSFVLTVVVIPVATVNQYAQAVFTVIVIWITCPRRMMPGLSTDVVKYRHDLALNWPAFQWMYLKGEPSVHSQPPSVMESWPPIHSEIPVGVCWITPWRKQLNINSHKLKHNRFRV